MAEHTEGAISTSLEDRIRRAQVELVFLRGRLASFMGIPASLLMAWFLWDLVDHRLLLAWAAAKTVVSAVREALTRRWLRSSKPDETIWARSLMTITLLDGVIYGLLGTVLWPAQAPVHAAFIDATLFAIAALGLIVVTPSFGTMTLFMVPLLLPAAVMQAWQGTTFGVYFGVGVLMFLATALSEGGKADRFTRETLRIRYRADELAEQRRQALEMAERNSAVKDRFLATMSHEMRTPLHGILGMARLVQSESRLDEPATARMKMLERTGEHLLGVINDVLDFSKIGSEGMVLRHEPFDLRGLLASVADVARVTAREKGLTLALDVRLGTNDAHTHRVMGDATRLQQILINLTGNAVKFTDHGGVTVRARDGVGDVIWIEVEDTGPGVPPADVGIIFDAFRQGDATDKRRFGGTGLGLTISRELARAMGGDLVYRHAPGGGALFVLTMPLPRADDQASPPPRAAPQPPPERLSGRVLLAEDNPVNLMLAQAILQRLGLTVLTAANGEEAVSRALFEAPDAILMDCQMPGMDGFEATRRIRQAEADEGRPARVPIIALTANALQGDREASLAAGMNDHLAKPFKPEDLAQALGRWLHHPAHPAP